MSLDQALGLAVASIPECVAGGYVDLLSGVLLSVKTVESHSMEVLDLLAAAATDLFLGQKVSGIGNLFRTEQGQGEEQSPCCQEIVINCNNLIQVFLRSKRDEGQAACFICRKSANLGMVLNKVRQAMPSLEIAA